MPTARLTVWSDYLCPWCYNAAVRLERMEAEFGAALEIEWRSYLLRPHPKGGAAGFPAEDDPPRRVSAEALEKFRRYAQSWQRPAAEPDAAPFRIPALAGEAGSDPAPPSHSVPAQVAAKAAAALGRDAFRALHAGLLAAYFREHRDISDRATLRSVWTGAGLPAADFARCDDPALLSATLREHEEAVAAGVTGAPTARMEGNDALILGANPLALYRRWIERKLDGRI